MNKKAYYRNLIELERKLSDDSFKAFYDVVDIFSQINVVASNLSLSAFTSSDVNNRQNNVGPDQERLKVTKSIDDAIQRDKQETLLRKFSYDLFELETFINNILECDGVSVQVHKILEGHLELVDEFANEFDIYRKQYARGKAYSLSFLAQNIITSLNNLKLVIGAILDDYQTKEVDEGYAQLELYLSHVPSLKQFGFKLQVLDEMYAEICSLLDVSVVDAPIVIEHIENGSLFARISGNQLAVGIITTIIGASATFCFAQFSATGKVVEIKPTVTVENLDQMFELSKKLEAEGYDVAGMQDHIYRSLKKLAKSADSLLGDQPSIEVNDKVFELDESNKTKLLEESKRKLLENKDYKNEA